MVLVVMMECRWWHSRVTLRVRMDMVRGGVAAPPAVGARPHGNGHVYAHTTHADAVGRCPSKWRGAVLMRCWACVFCRKECCGQLSLPTDSEHEIIKLIKIRDYTDLQSS